MAFLLDFLLLQHGPKGRRGVLVLLQNSHQVTPCYQADRRRSSRPNRGQLALVVEALQRIHLVQKVKAQIVRPHVRNFLA